MYQCCIIPPKTLVQLWPAPLWLSNSEQRHLTCKSRYPGEAWLESSTDVAPFFELFKCSFPTDDLYQRFEGTSCMHTVSMGKSVRKDFLFMISGQLSSLSAYLQSLPLLSNNKWYPGVLLGCAATLKIHILSWSSWRVDHVSASITYQNLTVFDQPRQAPPRWTTTKHFAGVLRRIPVLIGLRNELGERESWIPKHDHCIMQSWKTREIHNFTKNCPKSSSSTSSWDGL